MSEGRGRIYHRGTEDTEGKGRGNFYRKGREGCKEKERGKGKKEGTRINAEGERYFDFAQAPAICLKILRVKH